LGFVTEFVIHMKIILIGFMGSGKSTVGKILSDLLGIAQVEMDEEVLQKTNSLHMDEVFEKGGELLLRETEIAIAKELVLQDNLVISTGGGVVLNKIVLDYLKQNSGKIFFLDSTFEMIIKKIKSDQSRPLFRDKREAQSLYEFRYPLYVEYADEIIEVDHHSPEAIARMIQQGLSHGL
jgi:shikimate kinase